MKTLSKIANAASLSAFALVSSSALAAPTPPKAGGTTIPSLTPKGGALEADTLVTNLISWVLWAAGIIAFAYLIWGGIMFVTSKGDSGKATEARNTILYAIIGIIVVVLAIMILNFASNTGKDLALSI